MSKESLAKLPDYCFIDHPVTGQCIMVRKGEHNYFELEFPESPAKTASEMNVAAGVTIQQAKAMKVGTMFGWDALGADPDNYDENGNFREQKVVMIMQGRRQKDVVSGE